MAEDRRQAGSQAWRPVLAVGAPLLAGLMAVALIVVGAAVPAAGVPIAAAGALGLVVVIALLPVIAGRSEAGPARTSGSEDLSGAVRALEQLGEQQALSDDARRVLHRRRERELLRRAIEEDIAAEDWDAAMILVKELAERFGYRADAEEFRERIDLSRAEMLRRRVEEGTARIDALIIQRRWDQAEAEAARIGRLYPDSPRVEGLRHRVETARQSYKADLERRFLHAAQEERIDQAMELLKELDGYLSEGEAGPFREVARGVIGKARENLGAQFKLALQDRHWEKASQVGERIIRDFPNTRMATEVRSLLDTIRGRAGDQRAAS